MSIPRLLEHRLRTGLTLLGIALGITLLTAVALVNRSLLANFEDTFDRITGKADLQVSAGSPGFSEDALETVSSTPGVFKVAPLMQQVVSLQHKGASARLLLLGLDLLGKDDAYFRTYHSAEFDAIKRDPLPFLNATDSIILSRPLARRHGLKLHDRVQLLTSRGTQEFEVWGFIEDEGVGAAFGGQLGIMYYPAMQLAFERERSIDRIDVALAPGADPAAVSARLRARLGDGFVVERPARQSTRVAAMLAGLRSGLTMAGLIALCVGMFLIHNTLAISIAQRRRELGVLRALGMTRRQLALLITLEGTLFGVVGSALGVLAGAGLARAALGATAQLISDLYAPVLHAPELRFETVDVIRGLSLGAVSATFAAAYPAWMAARAQPSSVLSGVAPAIAGRRPSGLTRSDLLAALFIGCAPLLLRLPAAAHMSAIPFLASLLLALAGAALTPRLVRLVHAALRSCARWVSPETRLANDNLPRELGRTSSTAAALGLGVAMATSLAVLIGSAFESTGKWIEQSAPADLFVTSSSRFGMGTSYTPLSSTLGPELAKLPGVAAAEPLRFDEVAYRGANVKLMTLDMASYSRHGRTELLEGEMATIVDKLRAGAVMVSENFARRFDTRVGDHITLSGKAGTRAFEVAGVAVDYTSDLGTVMMDRGVYLTNWGDTRVSAYLLYLRDSLQSERVRDEIVRRHGTRYDLFVLTNREFRVELEGGMNRLFRMMHTLEIVALIIAALGVVNALCASVLDRLREIGILRAVGMKRRQVRKMIVTEAILIGVAAVLGGVLIGLIEGYVLLAHVNTAQSGWRFAYEPAWGSVALMAGAVLAVCAIAGGYPARLAATARVCDALVDR